MATYVPNLFQVLEIGRHLINQLLPWIMSIVKQFTNDAATYCLLLALLLIVPKNVKRPNKTFVRKF